MNGHRLQSDHSVLQIIAHQKLGHHPNQVLASDYFDDDLHHFSDVYEITHQYCVTLSDLQKHVRAHQYHDYDLLLDLMLSTLHLKRHSADCLVLSDAPFQESFQTLYHQFRHLVHKIFYFLARPYHQTNVQQFEYVYYSFQPQVL